MKVPPTGIGVIGVKDKITGTLVFPSNLSDASILKLNAITRPLMKPDEMACDGRTSEEVCTVISPPEVTAPMTNPDIVTINVLVFMVAPAVCMTTDETEVGPQEPVNDPRLLLPAVMFGVTDVAKKPTG